MHDLFHRLKFKRARSATNLLIASALLLGLMHIATFLTGFGVLGSSARLAEVVCISSGATIAIIALWLVGARILNSPETLAAEAIAEHINDGILFVQGDAVVFANTLARKLLKDDTGHARRLELTAEIRGVLDQSRQSHTPVLFDTSLDGRKRHFMVSKIHLPQTGQSTLERQIFVFQDVTFLRENEEAKVNFIGTLSHEIKTPITSLAMATAMLERTGFDPELVRIANADVARLRVLLEDLLNVSKLKIVRNPSSMQKQEANLTALVNQTVKAINVMAHEKGVRIVSNIQSQAHLIANIDPTKIAWVVSTLLTDAIRQTPREREVRVELSFLGKQAIFSVDYERRFDSLGPTGHAIVRDIIEAHAGQFTSLHYAEHRSVFKFSIHSYLKTTSTSKGVSSNEAHLVG